MPSQVQGRLDAAGPGCPIGNARAPYLGMDANGKHKNINKIVVLLGYDCEVRRLFPWICVKSTTIDKKTKEVMFPCCVYIFQVMVNLLKIQAMSGA